MKIPKPEEAFDDEYSERLLESLEELKASFEKLQNELTPEVSNLSEMLSYLEGRIKAVESQVQRRREGIILTDDNGVEHRIPKLEILHICKVTQSAKDQPNTNFPTPNSDLPCLRVFSATFPGIYYDFRAKGEIPKDLKIRAYKTLERYQGTINADSLLDHIANIIIEGKAFTLHSRKYGSSGSISIKINTF